ncbi:MAG TPA: hypothetical protein VF588_12275 [Pyrinomonadaceae bacterium]
MRRFRAAGLILLLLFALAAVVSALLPKGVCPAGGAALSPGGREFARLKNRVPPPPGPRDFDENVSLEALLRPGEDGGRWSESRAGRIEGYVVEVVEGGAEAANCYSYRRRDVHIHVAPRPDAPRSEWVVVEVTPRARRWAIEWGRDWSASALRRELTGRRCRFEGWLLFDREHAGESENTAPGARGNWRATAWELHPVTSIEVLS